MLHVSPTIVIPDAEMSEAFVRSSGPGGQNVNKVSTAVQLRFNVYETASLPLDVRLRLVAQNRNRINAAGELVISAQRHRNQSQNRADARARLADLIRAASHKPKPRKKTKPSIAANKRRLETKRQIGATKRRRTKQKPGEMDEA